MRALAEFVMRGRMQAVLVAAISMGSIFLAWLGAAVVALVILRKGTGPGGHVLLWAALPGLLVAVWQQDIGPLAVLLVAALIAALLRRSNSWPATLALAGVAGLLISTLLSLAAPAYLAQLADMLRQIVQEATRGMPDAQVQAPGVVAIAGILGLSASATAVMCVLLARWWQAQLYNPGGFRQEFHQLRLPPLLTVPVVAVGLVLSSIGPTWMVWAMIAGLPLVFAGFALVHGLVGQRGMSSGWLVAMYCLWLVSDWVKALLLLLAVADSWMNFRGRGPRAGNES